MNGSGEETTRTGDRPATVQKDPTAGTRPRSETILEEERVVVVFHLPEVPLGELGHRIRAGTLLVWSRVKDRPYHAMVPLPEGVGANPHLMRAHNGVVEFVFARAAA